MSSREVFARLPFCFGNSPKDDSAKYRWQSSGHPFVDLGRRSTTNHAQSYGSRFANFLQSRRRWLSMRLRIKLQKNGPALPLAGECDSHSGGEPTGDEKFFSFVEVAQMFSDHRDREHQFVEVRIAMTRQGRETPNCLKWS